VTAAFARLSRKQQVLLAVGLLLAIMVALFGIFGSAGRNNEFQPQNEFMLTPWIEFKIGGLDLSLTKAVFYVFLATALTCGAMVYIANRMQARPNRVQTAVEASYDLTFNQIVRNNMQAELARKWFPFIAAIFFFIWISNLIGYIPMPTNTEHPLHIGSLEVPAFAIYAATANVSVPLVLTLLVWFSYHSEGIRAKGLVKYVKGWVPAGVNGVAAVPIFFIEAISQFVRIISLSVRLFANLLAGHLLILFMGGGLVVILGLAALGPLTLIVATVFFIFEVVLIATLQAFIFATLTAIYLGEATEGH
jgi:F-type H+-transporting ATPase subunit a